MCVCVVVVGLYSETMSRSFAKIHLLCKYPVCANTGSRQEIYPVERANFGRRRNERLRTAWVLCASLPSNPKFHVSPHPLTSQLPAGTMSSSVFFLLGFFVPSFVSRVNVIVFFPHMRILATDIGVLWTEIGLRG